MNQFIVLLESIHSKAMCRRIYSYRPACWSSSQVGLNFFRSLTFEKHFSGFFTV